MDRRETTTDCISREQAIDGLCQNCEAFDCIVNGSYCGHDCTEVAILKNLPPVVNQKQVTGKLKTLDDSLLTDDSEACKEQKSKLESDLISRQAAIEAVANHFMTDALIRNPSASNDIEDWKKIAERVLSNLPPVEDMGEVSDGYHTFNQLYHQRAVFFATIVNQNKDNAWTTPEIRAILENAPPVEPERSKGTETMIVDGVEIEIDPVSYEVGYSHGQTAPIERTGEWVSLFDGNEWFIHCSKCKTQHYEEDLLMGGSELPDYCPNCGADMRREQTMSADMRGDKE